MPGAASVQVEGLKEFSTSLKAVDKAWAVELRKGNKAAADVVAAAGRDKAGSGLPVQQKVASSIRAAAGQLYASVIAGSASFPGELALGAFLGANQYPQFPAWVGNDWQPGGPGGPYALGEAIRDSEGEFMDVYIRMVDDLHSRAFNTTTN